MTLGFRDLEQIGRGTHLAPVVGAMKRVQGRQWDVASGGPGRRTAGFDARSTRLLYGDDSRLSDNFIDIVAVVAAIVVTTVIALAC